MGSGPRPSSNIRAGARRLARGLSAMDYRVRAAAYRSFLFIGYTAVVVVVGLPVVGWTGRAFGPETGFVTLIVFLYLATRAVSLLSGTSRSWSTRSRSRSR